ncbi:hypothetical protein EDB80DRAFT_682916 [Ilyonectria destructans]|nr:hypothetical protein EDB80DRAFT_682916 [Ilyonectria destructans]
MPPRAQLLMCLLNTVSVSHGTSWKDIVDWNAGIDPRCSNIWSTTPFWDRVLCVSSPGGKFVLLLPSNNITPGNGNAGGPGGSGDRYSNDVVLPPEGGTVAKGTTDRCGESAVAMSLFLEVNPSLGTVATKCSEDLAVGT